MEASTNCRWSVKNLGVLFYQANFGNLKAHVRILKFVRDKYNHSKSMKFGFQRLSYVVVISIVLLYS